MIAFLTSSPCVPNAPRAILNAENGFVDRLRQYLPQQMRCLFICSNPDLPDVTDHIGRAMKRCFEEAGFRFRSFDILDRRNQTQVQTLLWRSDLLILAGGHVPTQNSFFQEMGLKRLISDYQGVVLGISAGTMNAAELVYAQPELEGESAPDFQRYYPGLGLTKVMVLPHYQKVKDEYLDGKRLFEDITYPDSMGKTFHALPDGSYLLIEQGKTTLFGDAWVIRDGCLQRCCGWGQSVVLEK